MLESEKLFLFYSGTKRNNVIGETSNVDKTQPYKCRCETNNYSDVIIMQIKLSLDHRIIVIYYKI